MSDPRARFARALVTDMRDPLARIELAASELDELVQTPRARDLTTRISDAVEGLDQLIGRTLSVLRPPSPGSAREDVWPALIELHARLAPVLAARGITWDPPTHPQRTLLGERMHVRQAGAQLLRLIGAPGEIWLDLVHDGARYGLSLRAPALIHDDAAGADALEELRVFTLAHGGELEEGGASLFTAWLSPAEDACNAF